MLLNNDQISEIFQLVEYYTNFFLAETIGLDVLTKKDKKILTDVGIDLSIFKDSDQYIDIAYKFGMLASALGKKAVQHLTFAQLKRFIKSGKIAPLTSIEKFALEFVKRQAYSDIKGLGNRINKDTMEIFIEASKLDRLKYQKIIRESTKEVLKDRGTVKDLATKLGEKTKDWARDFNRIADYNMHSAYQQGIVTQLLEQEGEDCEVFYTVYKGACKHCVETYILDVKTGEPRIFKLKDIIANGSNIGRKVKDWKASINPIHPWCRCTIHKKPENSEWNVEKQRFTLVRETYGVKRKSKVSVTITKI
jgi:hypothetical protein